MLVVVEQADFVVVDERVAGTSGTPREVLVLRADWELLVKAADCDEGFPTNAEIGCGERERVYPPAMVIATDPVGLVVSVLVAPGETCRVESPPTPSAPPGRTLDVTRHQAAFVFPVRSLVLSQVRLVDDGVVVYEQQEVAGCQRGTPVARS